MEGRKHDGLWNSRKAYVSAVCRWGSLGQADSGELGRRHAKQDHKGHVKEFCIYPRRKRVPRSHFCF